MQKSNFLTNIKNKKILKIVALYILSIVLLILGFSYTAVPLYQLFCQSTGFGGTIKKIEKVNSDLINNLHITPDFLQTQATLLTGCINEQKSNIKELTIYFLSFLYKTCFMRKRLRIIIYID
jgi:cytochrome c oxidase assembly protein Cox11